MKWFKRFMPGYDLAQQKREYERYLRSLGYSKKEALSAVAKKFPREGVAA